MKNIALLTLILTFLLGCGSGDEKAQKFDPDQAAKTLKEDSIAAGKVPGSKNDKSIAIPGSKMAKKEKALLPKELPVKGLVNMIDLGADKCIPCKMMAPILLEVSQEYQGRAFVTFIDVWVDPSQAKKFNIRAIPTQIFFDRNGAEVYRHIGFLSKENIVAIFNKLGVN